jgi:hypothetical protein
MEYILSAGCIDQSVLALLLLIEHVRAGFDRQKKLLRIAQGALHAGLADDRAVP